MTKEYHINKFGNWFEFETKLDYEYAKAESELCSGLIEFKFNLDGEGIEYLIREGCNENN